MGNSNELHNKPLKNIDGMDGHQFEDLVERLIKKMGFVTEERKITSDGGVDIKAVNEQPLFGGKYIIQCKRHTGPIGEPTIRDLYGVVASERANKGILITNSHFTKTAKDFARAKPLELIDGEKLSTLLDKYLGQASPSGGSEPVILNVPEAYKITAEILGPTIEKVVERRRKVSGGLIFLGKRTYDDVRGYIKHIEKKASKLAEWCEVFTAQLNHLNRLWEGATGKNESYENLRKVKAHCWELVKTIQLLEKEWEEAFSIVPLDDLQKTHSLFCEAYDHLLTSAKSCTDNLLQVIASPEDFTHLQLALKLPEGFGVKLREEIQRAERKIKQESSAGCLTALGWGLILGALASFGDIFRSSGKKKSRWW